MSASKWFFWAKLNSTSKDAAAIACESSRPSLRLRFRLLCVAREREGGKQCGKIQIPQKSQKKSNSTLRAKRATFILWVDKSPSKMPKMVNLTSFWNPEACSQTVLPLTKQVNFKNKYRWKILEWQKFKCDLLDDFQTLCIRIFAQKLFNLSLIFFIWIFAPFPA